MTSDTPKLNEVERKIAKGLTVYPRELLDAEMEVFALQIDWVRNDIDRDFSGLCRWLLLKLWNSAVKAISFYFSISRPANLKAYYKENSKGTFQEIVKSRSKRYRFFITNREGEGKQDAN
jgi:hypothetical protein